MNLYLFLLVSLYSFVSSNPTTIKEWEQYKTNHGNNFLIRNKAENVEEPNGKLSEELESLRIKIKQLNDEAKAAGEQTKHTAPINSKIEITNQLFDGVRKGVLPIKQVVDQFKQEENWKVPHLLESVRSAVQQIQQDQPIKTKSEITADITQLIDSVKKAVQQTNQDKGPNGQSIPTKKQKSEDVKIEVTQLLDGVRSAVQQTKKDMLFKSQRTETKNEIPKSIKSKETQLVDDGKNKVA